MNLARNSCQSQTLSPVLDVAEFVDVETDCDKADESTANSSTTETTTDLDDSFQQRRCQYQLRRKNDTGLIASLADG